MKKYFLSVTNNISNTELWVDSCEVEMHATIHKPGKATIKLYKASHSNGHVSFLNGLDGLFDAKAEAVQSLVDGFKESNRINIRDVYRGDRYDGL